MIRRGALVGLFTVLLMAFFSAIPASAIPGIDCVEAPVPEVPGRGVVGFFEATPNPLPAPEDPFAPNAATTPHEQFGYAGLRWSTYDLGCGPDALRSPDASMGTPLANWIFTLPKTMVALTGSVISASYEPDFLTTFDPLVENVVSALRRGFFDQWSGLVVAAMGLLILWRARSARMASSAGAIGWALLVMMIASVVFAWPLAAGRAADASVKAVLGSVTTALTPAESENPNITAADHTTNTLTRAVLYQPWLGGMFGNTSSATANKYGSTLYSAQALNWSEAQLLNTDPAASQQLIEAKKQLFEDTAAKVKAEDADAYEYLTGRRSDTRLGYSFLSLVAALCAVPFLFMASLLVIGSLIIVRLGVMFFPVIATLGLFPSMRPLVVAAFNTVGSALINAVIFGIGSAVTIRGFSVLLDPATGLAPWLQLVLILLLTILMWVALSPFRRLTAMVDQHRNPFSGSARAMRRGMGSVVGQVTASATGGFVGGRAARAEAAPIAVPQGDKPMRIEGASSIAELSGSTADGSGRAGLPAVSSTAELASARAESIPAIESGVRNPAPRVSATDLDLRSGTPTTAPVPSQSLYQPLARSSARESSARDPWEG